MGGGPSGDKNETCACLLEQVGDLSVNEANKLDGLAGDKDKDDVVCVTGVQLVGLEGGAVGVVEIGRVDGAPVDFGWGWGVCSVAGGGGGAGGSGAMGEV